MKPSAALAPYLYACAAILFSLGCGSSSLPPENELHQRIGELEDSGISDMAPESWKEVKRLTALGDKAAADKDKALSEHFYDLADLQIQAATAESKYRTLKSRADAALLANESLQKEIDALESGIAEKQKAAEQARLRAHLLSVVDETRRKAAAEEEYRARFKGEKTVSARMAVGGQMLERARVFLDIAALWIKRGALVEDAVASLRVKEEAAVAALKTGDLFAVQQATEHIILQGRKLMENAYADKGAQTAEDAIKDAASALTTLNVEFIKDEPGLWVHLGDKASSADPKTEALLSSIYRLYKQQGNISFVLLSSAPRVKEQATAEKRSNRQAADWTARLIELGIDSRHIRSRGCGRFVPVAPLHRETSPAVLLVVPVFMQK